MLMTPCSYEKLRTFKHFSSYATPISMYCSFNYVHMKQGFMRPISFVNYIVKLSLKFVSYQHIAQL